MKTLLARAVLVVFGVALGMLGVELGYRLYLGEDLGAENYLLRDLDFLHTRRWPTEYHPELGWVPKSNNSDPGNIWGMATLEHGVRSNGPQSSAFAGCDPHVLAVGDSFTWGDEVSNSDSWPAQLEREIRARVVNAGVYNYGIDQTYLRLLDMLEVYEPRTVAVGLFGDDIYRAALWKRHGLQKPYFELRDGKLELRNVPVPPPPSSIRRHGLVLGMMAHSLVAHHLMKSYYPELWFVGREPDVSTGQNPLDLSCEILRRVDALLAEREIPGVLVLQYAIGLDDYRQTMLQLLDCAKPEHLEIVDTYPALRTVLDERPRELHTLAGSHLTPLGNRLVAGLVASALKSPAFPPPSCGTAPAP